MLLYKQITSSQFITFSILLELSLKKSFISISFTLEMIIFSSFKARITSLFFSLIFVINLLEIYPVIILILWFLLKTNLYILSFIIIFLNILDLTKFLLLQFELFYKKDEYHLLHLSNHILFLIYSLYFLRKNDYYPIFYFVYINKKFFG